MNTLIVIGIIVSVVAIIGFVCYKIWPDAFSPYPEDDSSDYSNIAFPMYGSGFAAPVVAMAVAATLAAEEVADDVEDGASVVVASPFIPAPNEVPVVETPAATPYAAVANDKFTIDENGRAGKPIEPTSDTDSDDLQSSSDDC